MRPGYERASRLGRLLESPLGSMGKKYKVVHKQHGKKLKKGQELEADELSLSRAAGKPGCYRALQCLGILLTMMGVNFAVMRDDLRMLAREVECWECNSTDPTEEERLLSVFNRLDQNGDGLLSRGEVQQEGSKLLEQPLTPSGLDATMTEMDKDQSGDIDFDEFSKQRWPGMWILFGVTMMVLAYCVGGVVGGKKAETLTLHKQDGQWSVSLADVSWGRVVTNRTTYSLRKDTLARVGLQAGRKITAYAVYVFIDGEPRSDGSRPEVRIWAGNKQRAEFVCKAINRFFHGPSMKRGWKSVLGTIKEGGDTNRVSSGNISGGQAQLGKQTGLVRFGSPTLWKSQAPVSNTVDATEVADAAMRDWAVQDWVVHAPLLEAENEDARLASLRVELEQLQLPALRARAVSLGLGSELEVAEDAVAVANALVAAPHETAQQIRATLETMVSLLGRNIHHTTVGEREQLSCIVREILRDIGDAEHGVVGAISSMKRMAFGEAFTLAEWMAAVRQTSRRLEGSDTSTPLCNVRSRDYCPCCSASFGTMKRLVRELDICTHWQRGEDFPLARVDPWIVSGRCRNAQLRALLRSEMESAELGPVWAAERRDAAVESHMEARMELAEDTAVAEAIEKAYESFDRVDTHGSGILTAEGVELLCRDSALIRSFVPVGGHFTDMSKMEQANLLSGLQRRVSGDGQLGIVEFEQWFEQEARVRFKDHIRQRRVGRQNASDLSQRIVTALSTRGKNWGLEEEIDCTLHALELGRSLLAVGAGGTYAVECLLQLLSHVQSVLDSVARRAAKHSPNGLPMTTSDQQEFQRLAEKARSHMDRVYVLQQDIISPREGAGTMAALEVMSSRDVFVISHRASVAAKLIDADQAVADRTDMETCCEQIGRLLDALEPAMSWQGLRGPLGSVKSLPGAPQPSTHLALSNEFDSDDPWEWNDLWFTFPIRSEAAIILLLLKRSQAESTGVRFTSNGQLNIQTDDAALNDGSMGSLVKMLLKRKTAVAAEGQIKPTPQRQAIAMGSVDHTLRIAHRPSKREEELQESAKRVRRNAGETATALERAPDVSRKLAIALQNADEFKLGEEGREILAFLQEHQIIHDTIVQNEAALACGANRNLGGITPKEHKTRRLRFIRYIDVAQSVFHPESGVQGMRLPDHMGSFLDPTVNTVSESGTDCMSETGSLIRTTLSRRAEHLETSRRNYYIEGESASDRYEDAFMQIDPGWFNLPALSVYIRLSEKYAGRTVETTTEELVSSIGAQSTVNGVSCRDMVDHIQWLHEEVGKGVPLPRGVELGEADLQPWHKHTSNINDSAKAVDTTLLHLQENILQKIHELHRIQERWDAQQAAAIMAEQVQRSIHNVQVTSMVHIAGSRWRKALQARGVSGPAAGETESLVSRQPVPEPEPEPEPEPNMQRTEVAGIAATRQQPMTATQLKSAAAITGGNDAGAVEGAGGDVISHDDVSSRSQTPPRKPAQDSRETKRSAAASRAKTPPRRPTGAGFAASSIDAHPQLNQAGSDADGSGAAEANTAKPSTGKTARSSGASRAAALAVLKAKKAKGATATDDSAVAADAETASPPNATVSDSLTKPPTVPKSAKEKAAAMREAKRAANAKTAAS